MPTSKPRPRNERLTHNRAVQIRGGREAAGPIFKEVAVKQNDEAPVAVEVLAESIKAISDGVKKLRAGRLNDKALLLLIQHACPAERKYGPKPGVGTIRAVLAGMDSLERTYLKPKAKQ